MYSDRLPYHNFGHIEGTLAAADKIAGRCQAEGIRIDLEVVYFALLFHDAGYQDDHRQLGYHTKEDYAAALATTALRERGALASQIEKVISAIMSTERNASFVSVEQKAVRAADLSGMAAPYDEFLRSSLNLKREFKVLYGKELRWEEWQETSREVLEFYMNQEIRLTSYFYNESRESEFHTAVKRNLDRLLLEASAPQVAR